jgi:hypothetical protein
MRWMAEKCFQAAKGQVGLAGRHRRPDRRSKGEPPSFTAADPPGLVRLRQKGGTQRWQPVTLDLAIALADHARRRGAVLPADALLRF